MRSFYAAFYNLRQVAPYDQPTARHSSTLEYLIVNRLFEDRIFVSTAGAAPKVKPSAAPAEIREENTLIGSLVSADPSGAQETFIFNRGMPKDAVLRGRFFPADGTATLCEDKQGRLSLRAFGRHAHAEASDCGRMVLVDVTARDLKTDWTCAWHYEATALSWSQEIIDPNH